MKSFEQKITVRWADLDPNGHVRHSIYYDYGAQARIAYLQREGFGLDWMKRMLSVRCCFERRRTFTASYMQVMH